MGVCLTATQCSQNLGGLWVAEWSTWCKPASPFYPLPSPSEGTQSRHCVGNDCALKMEPRRSKGKRARRSACARAAFLSPLFFAVVLRECVFIPVFSQPSLTRLCFLDE